MKQQLKTFAGKGTYVPEDDMICPLCCETMDVTDISHRPCPCGYRMCLFCYKKVVEMCNSVCPNCRREYGSAMDDGDACNNAAAGYAAEQRVPQHPAPAARTVCGAGGAGHGGSGGGGLGVHGAGGVAAHHMAVAAAQKALTANAANKRPAAAGAAGNAAARPRGEGAGGGQGPGGAATRHKPDDTPALPSGATWATQAKPVGAAAMDRDDRDRHGAQPPAPIIADASAWPDLAAATAPPPPPPPPQPRVHKERESSPNNQRGHQQQQQQQQHQQAPNQQPPHQQQQAATTTQQQHQHPARATDTPAPGPAPMQVSRMDSMACDPVVSPEVLGLQPNGAVLGPHGAGNPYQTAQVATSVFGGMRNVNVVLPGNGPQPEMYAEAPGLRANIDKALAAGTMTTQQASAELLSLLRQKDGARQQAATRPPPGFGAPAANFSAAPQGVQQGPGSMLLSPADSPVVPHPPIGRYQPIGKPIGPPPGSQQQGFPSGLSNNSNSRYAAPPAARSNSHVPGTYSLWSGHAPTIDLGPAGNPNSSSSATSFNNWLGGASSGPSGPMHDAMHAGALSSNGFGGFGNGLLGPGAGAGFAPLINKPPPPGFGGPVAPLQAYQQQSSMGGVADNSMLGPQPGMANDGYYNLFNFAAARGPPPGMTAVYR